MSFESIDALQRSLADTVFGYASDRKKAAGRALGTLVELVTYYTLRSWNLSDHIVIERRVTEFANPDIMHNVEFSLHYVKNRYEVKITPLSLPLTATKIKNQLLSLRDEQVKSTQILSKDYVKRNSTVLVERKREPMVANIDSLRRTECNLVVCELSSDPFATFECKRVGVEEGMRKGPQTIEKAKQGAYVARSISSLQKVRLRNGQFQRIIEKSDGSFKTGPYQEVLRELIDMPSLLDFPGFVLTVGVVSNHGNWFTSDNHNKELRVLAQSYDWLLFLTDHGLSEFINKLILHPLRGLEVVKDSFLKSYSGKRGMNRFTKVRIDAEADEALQRYFAENKAKIESWYNIISPGGRTLNVLRKDLEMLAGKRPGVKHK